MTISLQQTVPSFTLTATGDKKITIPGGDKHSVIYPKDRLVTTQDKLDLKEFAENNTVIYGILRDSLKSHENFKSKQEFNFDLLDTEEIEHVKFLM